MLNSWHKQLVKVNETKVWIKLKVRVLNNEDMHLLSEILSCYIKDNEHLNVRKVTVTGYWLPSELNYP